MRPSAPITGRVLIVESDQPLAAMLAELIRTHCPGTRVDACSPDARTLIEDNCGGADLAVIACHSTRATTFDALRELLTLRPCLAVLALIPADRPDLADAAIAAGAADVLLRAPGYLDQFAVSVRKNIRLAKARTVEQVRSSEFARQFHERGLQVAALRRELAESIVSRPAEDPAPIIRIRPVGAAKAA